MVITKQNTASKVRKRKKINKPFTTDLKENKQNKIFKKK